MTLKPNHRLNQGELYLLLALLDDEMGKAQASLPPRKPRMITSAIHKLMLQLEMLD